LLAQLSGPLDLSNDYSRKNGSAWRSAVESVGLIRDQIKSRREGANGKESEKCNKREQ
jgi:hypothetical protein